MLADLALDDDRTLVARPARVLGRLVHALYALRPVELARFAPLAFALVDEDEVATAILRDSVEALAALLRRVRALPGRRPARLRRQRPRRGLPPPLPRRSRPRCSTPPTAPSPIPVADGLVGAAVLALREGDIEVDDDPSSPGCSRASGPPRPPRAPDRLLPWRARAGEEHDALMAGQVEPTMVPTSLGSVAVHVLGAGRPTVLWHSMFVDGSSWGFLIPALLRGRQLLIVDGPGWGRSDRLRRTVRVLDSVAAAVEVLTALAPGAAVDWVGNGWGGHIGMELAATRPSWSAAWSRSAPRPGRSTPPCVGRSGS